MKPAFVLCALFLASLMVSCTTQHLGPVGERVQKVRLDNALTAKAARIHVWHDTSTYDQQGWHLHSDRKEQFTLPDDEFKKARGLIIAHGATWQRQNPPAGKTDTIPPHVVELEWVSADGSTIGGIDLLGIRKESQLDNTVTTEFPFVLPDEAYEQFMAIPTISKALGTLSK